MKKFVFGFMAAFAMGLGASAVQAEGVGVEDVLDECEMAYAFGGPEASIEELAACREAAK